MRWLGFLVGMLWLGLVGQAHAQSLEQAAPPAAAATEVTYSLDGAALVVRAVTDGVTSESRVELPCVGRAVAQAESTLYVACGTSGVARLDVSDPRTPRPRDVRAVDGEVVGLFVLEGRVWAQVASLHAQPVDALSVAQPTPTPSAPSPASFAQRGAALQLPPPPPEQSPPAPVFPEGHVRAPIAGMELGTVLLDVGSAQGVARGMRVELYRHVGGAAVAGLAERDEVIGVGEVIGVTPEATQLRVGVDVVPELGALARPTIRPLEAFPLAPPRPLGLAVSANVRAFLPVGTLGVGTLSDAQLVYRASFPLSVHLVLDPIGLGWADAGNVAAFAGHATVALDTQFFEFGFGAGWTSVNRNRSLATRTSGLDQTTWAFSLTPHLRIGAVDGLSIETSFDVYVGSQFEFGNFAATIQIPVGERWWILLRGGGLNAGHEFGEGGVRYLLQGNGGPGSLFIAATIGGAGLQFTAPGLFFNTVHYGGPSLGIGLEYRP